MASLVWARSQRLGADRRSVCSSQRAPSLRGQDSPSDPDVWYVTHPHLAASMATCSMLWQHSPSDELGWEAAAHRKLATSCPATAPPRSATYLRRLSFPPLPASISTRPRASTHLLTRPPPTHRRRQVLPDRPDRRARQPRGPHPLGRVKVRRRARPQRL